MSTNHYATPTERKTIVLVAVLFFNLILVSTQVVLDNEKTLFQNIIGTLISPFQIGFQKSVHYISSELEHYAFLKDTYKKYSQLRIKYVDLLMRNYKLKQKIKEVEFLEALNRQEDFFLRADTISIDRNFPYSSIMINKGSNHGIVKDMIVLNREWELVGKVIPPITPFSAKVRLVTSSVGGIGAYIEPGEDLEGLLTGNNSAMCDFKYLMENKPVKVGDRVVTSGTDLIYPYRILIGKVVHVEKNNLTQRIKVEPFFTKKSIKHLVVIANEQSHIIQAAQSSKNTSIVEQKK